MKENIDSNFHLKCLGANSGIKKFKSPNEMLEYFDETISYLIHEYKGDQGILKKLDK